MTDDDKIADMLLSWEEARERGQPVTAEELCMGDPELLDAVRERIRLLENAGWMQEQASQPPASPRTLAERYALEQVIGTGGYAQVWRAYDLQLHRHVAIKVSKPSRTIRPDQMKEVLAEARRVARLKHPNIVVVHDVVKEGAGYFIVADLINGVTLAERLRQGKPSVEEAVKLVAQVARIIDYAHREGVVHRDLKPANIFLDAAGQPHVGDFGIAQSQQELLNGSDRRGTLAYAAPEQLEGKPLDGRADIWSLGVVLFEMLMGRKPFTDDNPVRLQQAILTNPPPALPDVPQAVSAVCRRCLARKPEERFARGNELADALEAAVASAPPRRWTLYRASILGMAVLVMAGVLAWAKWPRHQPEGIKPLATPTRSELTDPLPPAVAPPTKDDAFRVFRGHDGAVRAVTISSNDMMASAGEDGKVRLWPVTGGEVIVLDHDGPVNAVHMGRRGHTILTGTEKGAVNLWWLPPRTDAERIAAGLRFLALPTASPLAFLAGVAPWPEDAPWKMRTFPAKVGSIKAVAMSADGQFLAWAGAEKLEVWEVAGEPPLTIARTPGDIVHHFAFLKDGMLLAAFGYSPQKKVTTRAWVTTKVNERWVATARPAGQNLELFTDVRSFTTSPDRSAVLVTQSKAVRVFSQDAKAAGLLLAGSYESPKIELNTSIILPGQRAATVAKDYTIRVWAMANQTELATLHGHTKAITSIASSESGNIIATASEDGTVRLWKSP